MFLRAVFVCFVTNAFLCTAYMRSLEILASISGRKFNDLCDGNMLDMYDCDSGIILKSGAIAIYLLIRFSRRSRLSLRPSRKNHSTGAKCMRPSFNLFLVVIDCWNVCLRDPCGSQDRLQPIEQIAGLCELSIGGSIGCGTAALRSRPSSVNVQIPPRRPKICRNFVYFVFVFLCAEFFS